MTECSCGGGLSSLAWEDWTILAIMLGTVQYSIVQYSAVQYNTGLLATLAIVVREFLCGGSWADLVHTGRIRWVTISDVINEFCYNQQQDM